MLRYDPENPKQLDFTTGWDLASFGWPIGLGLLSLFFFLMSLIPLGKQLESERFRAYGAARLKGIYLGAVFLNGTALTVAIGAWALTFGISTLMGAANLQAWPETEAVVVSSRSDTLTERENRVSVTHFVAIVNARYTVSDKLYTAPLRDGRAPDEARIKTLLAERYAPGRKVRVAYNPANPWQIYAPGKELPHDTFKAISFCVLGVFCLLGAAIWSLFMLISLRKLGQAEA